MACLDARQDRLQVSHTQILIRTKALLGDLIHCGFTWKTQRSTFLVCDKTVVFTCTFTERSRILNIDSAPVLKTKVIGIHCTTDLRRHFQYIHLIDPTYARVEISMQ